MKQIPLNGSPMLIDPARKNPDIFYKINALAANDSKRYYRYEDIVEWEYLSLGDDKALELNKHIKEVSALELKVDIFPPQSSSLEIGKQIIEAAQKEAKKRRCNYFSINGNLKGRIHLDPPMATITFTPRFFKSLRA